MRQQQKSLVLITVDCLRADHCGFYGYSRPTTPFLDSLAAESFVVPAAVVAGAPTYYSFPAILASRMPLALGRDVIGLAPGENTLATALREAGYATGAFCAANPYISPHFGYDQGFEVFQDFHDFDRASTQTAHEPRSSEQRSPEKGRPGQGSSEQRSPDPPGTRSRLNRSLQRAARAAGLGSLYNELYFQYRLRVAAPAVHSMDSLRKFPSAEVIVDHAISWLASATGRPFFLWLHLMDPHSPYYPSPAAYRELFGREASASRARYLNEFWNRSDLSAARLGRKKHLLVELYDAGIRLVDSQVGRLVAHLKQSDLWDNCAFALTADHGEEFLDHGRRYHAPVSVHEEIVRVPLMLRVPASAKREVPASPFSHLHLAPTLLEILNVPAPGSFRGASLWRNLQQGIPWDDPAITECVYGCTNPFHARDRMGARLLSVRNARHKLVMRIEAGAVEEIYDLQADPREERPLPPAVQKSGAQKEVRAHLLQAAQRHMQQTSGARDITARLQARLRDLRVELESNSR